MTENTMPAAATRYSPLSILLHWAIFVLVSACAIIVWYADDLDDRALHRLLVDWHRSIGITILLLMLLRMAAALFTPRPGQQLRPRLQQHAIRLVHGGFYVALIAIPLLGWLMTSAAGKPLSWFGLLTLPSLLSRDRDLAETLHDLHTEAAEILLIVIGLHAAMALWHHYRDRDGSLQRMLPAAVANRLHQKKNGTPT